MANNSPGTPTGAIAANINSYRYIVEALRDLEYAPAAVAELEAQMAVIRANIAKEEKGVNILRHTTKRLLKEWQESQGNSGQRLWAKIKHMERKNLSPQQLAKEKAYTDAQEYEQSYHLRIRVLEGKDAELVQQVKELQPVVNEHTRLRTRLDALYDGVFQSPGAAAAFPEQDAAERKFESARALFRELEPMLHAESNTLERLGNAHDKITEAVHHMRVAITSRGSETARMDAQKAATAATQATQKTYKAAQKAKPTLDNVTMPKIVLSDLFRFNGWSAIGLADLQDALQEIRETETAIHSVMDRQKQDVTVLEGKMERAQMELRRATDKLETVRRRIFEGVLVEADSVRDEMAVFRNTDSQRRRDSPSERRADQATRPPSYTSRGAPTPLPLKEAVLATVPISSPSPMASPVFYSHQNSFSTGRRSPVRQLSNGSESIGSAPSHYSRPTPGLSHAMLRGESRESRTSTDTTRQLPCLSPPPPVTPTSEYFSSVTSNSHHRPSSLPIVGCDTGPLGAESHSVFPIDSPIPVSPPMSAINRSTRPLPTVPSSSRKPGFGPRPQMPTTIEPRTRSLSASEHIPERGRLSTQTVPPIPGRTSSDQTMKSPPPAAYDAGSDELAKLHREGQRALLDVERATEELDRIRKEILNRSGARGSADSDMLLLSDNGHPLSTRKLSRQPPPTYSVQRRDDERGFFYISNC